MKRYYLFLILSLVQLSSSLFCAQEENKPFIVQVRTDKGKTPMTFFICITWREVSLGFDNYNQTAIPIETRGEIFIPDSVTTPNGQRLPIRWVSRGSFQGCQNITKIHLPHPLEAISDLAFQNCKSLREITLSDSLQVIYPQAFEGCDAIRRIICPSSNPPRTYHEGTFEENLFNTTTIVVPAASADKYRKDNLFSRFRYHAELIPTYPKQ